MYHITYLLAEDFPTGYLTLNYPMKNVPPPSKKLYLKCLTEKVEKFIKRIRWKAMFYEQNNNLDDDEPQRTMDLKLSNAHHNILILNNLKTNF